MKSSFLPFPLPLPPFFLLLSSCFLSLFSFSPAPSCPSFDVGSPVLGFGSIPQPCNVLSLVYRKFSTAFWFLHWPICQPREYCLISVCLSHYYSVSLISIFIILWSKNWHVTLFYLLKLGFALTCDQSILELSHVLVRRPCCRLQLLNEMHCDSLTSFGQVCTRVYVDLIFFRGWVCLADFPFNSGATGPREFGRSQICTVILSLGLWIHNLDSIPTLAHVNPQRFLV